MRILQVSNSRLNNRQQTAETKEPASIFARILAEEISGEILNWLMRGAPKTITEVTSRLEEMFDAEGNETGSKMVKQTITKGTK